MSRYPFESVLVANRGEIAARILRSVKESGLRGVIIAHPDDAHGPAMSLADEVSWIDGPTPVAAFLDIDQIINAAKVTEAGALHPGYGFLAENARFATAVEKAGIVFIGPRPSSIELMGDKIRARNFVAQLGIPVAPSVIEDDDPGTFVDRARELGVPLLIKPSAGGGGKGMHIVRNLRYLDAEIERARSEGQRYFGDGRLYAERYIECPRHIEVQVLGDESGNVVHLFERDCSLQRRFQKVIEEAPAPGLPANIRDRICNAAVDIARAAQYVNAGTVEFIYGAGQFYFLEMNTRLQVEHPVTEATTGIDLVAEQIRIAAGEPLSFEQNDVTISGHAIELRIYAEDSSHDFAPTTGPILRLQPPNDSRFDAGVIEGGRVTTAFDPMIGKLIVHGESRAAALIKAEDALRRLIVLGLRTNVGYLRRLLTDREVAAGRIHTGLIQEKFQLTAEPPLERETVARLIALAAPHVPDLCREAAAVPALHRAMGSWRN